MIACGIANPSMERDTRSIAHHPRRQRAAFGDNRTLGAVQRHRRIIKAMSIPHSSVSSLRELVLRSEDCEEVASIALEIAAADEHIDDEALQRIRACLETAGEVAQGSLTRACVLTAPHERLPLLAEEFLHDRRDLVRDAAAHALAELGPPAFPALRELLNDEDREVRWYATEALAREARSDSMDLLVEQLGDEDFSIRWVASNGLIEVGAASVIPVVTALARHDPSQLFHNAARRVLSRVQASPLLQEMLQDLVESLSRPTTVYESQALALEILKRLRGDDRA